MARKLLLEVVTPEKLLLSQEVDEVIAPGSEGDFGVLPGHCHFISLLRIGELRYRVGGAMNYISVLSGFAEVTPQKVTILAVSVDPKGDTRTAAMSFSEQHKMTGYWHFLIGTQNQLSPVWTAYAIDAQRISASTSTHTSALYMIDKEGHERVLLDQDFTSAQMTSDLKTLLGE